MGCGGSTFALITSHDEAILDLKVGRDKLIQLIRRYNSEIERADSTLRQLIATGRRDQAKLVLRRKNAQNRLIEKSRGALENVRTMINEIESTQTSVVILDALREGNQTLNDLATQCGSIEQVESLLLDTKDSLVTQQEIEASLDSLYREHFPDEVEQIEDTQAIVLPTVPLEEPQSVRVKSFAVESNKIAILAS